MIHNIDFDEIYECIADITNFPLATDRKSPKILDICLEREIVNEKHMNVMKTYTYLIIYFYKNYNLKSFTF